MSFGIPVRNGLSVGLLASTFLTSGSGRLVPRLTLNFLTGSPLDSRITFSRTTNATLVDATGRVTYAPNNLVLRSEEFDTASWVKTASTITPNATTAPNGTTTADKLVENTAVTTGHFISPSPSPTTAGATVGQFYIYSVYAKAGERTFFQLIATGVGVGGGNLVAGFDLTNGTAGTPSATVTSAITPAGDGWYRCSMAFPISTAAAGGYQIRLSLNSTTTPSSYTGDGVSGAFIWGAQFEQVTYQTLPSTYVQTVASVYYGPRFDYDPVTLAPRGLLIEEQRTNLLLYSEQFDNVVYTKTNSTITANATTAPDGTVTGDKHVPNLAAILGTSPTQTRIQQNVTSTSGTSYTFTIYAKAGEFDQIEFAMLATPTASALFSLTSGTVVSGTGASITPAGNGWYRCVLTFTAGATGSLSLRWTAQSSTVLVGDGTSGIFVWGAQIEVGSFATSYIPTVASTVTRASDNSTMTGTNFSSWFNASEGTFVASAAVLSTASNRGVYAASDGSGANELFHYVSTTANNLVTTASVAQANVIISGPVSINTVFSDALAYRENDISAAFNGVLGTPDTSATLPVVNQLRLGARGDAALRLNGHLRTFTYYATRLTNAQLQALTS